MMAKNKEGKAFKLITMLIMLGIILITLYPFWYILIGSLNEGLDYVRGGVYILPRKFTIDNYRAVFMEKDILSAFVITILRTVIGTVSSILVTAMFSYAFSRKELIGRNVYAAIGLVTLYFSGGLIPTYLNIKMLGLTNNFLVYIIPTAFYFFNVLIFQSFFREVPGAMLESAKIDGAGEYKIFFRLVIPVSGPVIATIALFTAVWHWNSYYDSMLYTTLPQLQTIQLFLMKMIRNKEAAAALSEQLASKFVNKESVNSTTIQLATMIVTTVPIIIVYPFLQKYFVKGVMIGSVKG